MRRSSRSTSSSSTRSRSRTSRGAWTLGAGPALIIESHHNETDAGGGLNFVMGIQHRKGLFTELKVGAIDSPTIKFCVGYVFH